MDCIVQILSDVDQKMIYHGLLTSTNDLACKLINQ